MNSRPAIITLGSGISILGAIVTLVTLGFQVNEGWYNFGNIAASALIAILFFATAGTFYKEGRNNQVTCAAIVAFNIAAILISQFVGGWVDNNGLYILMILCAVIAGVVACTKTAKEWFTAEVIEE